MGAPSKGRRGIKKDQELWKTDTNVNQLLKNNANVLYLSNKKMTIDQLFLLSVYFGYL